MNPFETSVAAALGEGFRGETLLAAVSGGADSTAMLCALAAIRPAAGFSLRCLHVDHGIRPPAESGGDAEFVAALCETLGVPCRIAAVPPGRVAATAKRLSCGMEAAARLYRRRAWNREARRTGAAAILTAHTRDDMLETVLMRVLRGSGPAGLAAMPVRRGRIFRPLLELDRAGVLRYLAEKNMPHRTDRTNGDNRFFRNALRNRLIPLLDSLFPPWRRGLRNLAETQRLAADFLAAEAASRLPWEGGRELRAGAAEFFSLPPILREEALFRGIDRLLAGTDRPVPVKRSNVRAFGRGERALDLGPCRVKTSGNQVVLSRPAGNGEWGFSLLIKAPGLYKLGKVVIELLPVLHAGDRKTGGFFAFLPLLIRRSFRSDRIVRGGRKSAAPENSAAVWCAVDPRGPAAFIGAGSGGPVLLLDRGEPDAEKSGPGAGPYYCVFSEDREV